MIVGRSIRRWRRCLLEIRFNLGPPFLSRAAGFHHWHAAAMEDKPTILYFHGNGANAANRLTGSARWLDDPANHECAGGSSWGSAW